MRVWKTESPGWVVDFVSTMNNPTDSILTILEYRYWVSDSGQRKNGMIKPPHYAHQKVRIIAKP